MAKIIRSHSAGWLFGFGFLLISVWCSPGADLAIKFMEKAPPAEVDESIKNVLQSKAVQLSEDGKPMFEFWFRQEIPLKSNADSPLKAVQSIGETTFCGVISVEKTERDYKDSEISEGLYTARFGIQPQDGDHLGTSEFPYFLVLIPLKNDPKLNGLTAYKPMVRASGKATPSGHPVVWSLRIPASFEGDDPKLNEPVPGHKSFLVRVPARESGSDKATSVVFELVYRGKGKT